MPQVVQRIGQAPVAQSPMSIISCSWLSFAGQSGPVFRKPQPSVHQRDNRWWQCKHNRMFTRIF